MNSQPPVQRTGALSVATRLIASALAPARALPLMELHRDNLASESESGGSDVTRLIQRSFGNVIMSAVSLVGLRVREWMSAKADALKQVAMEVVTWVMKAREWMSDEPDALKRVATKGAALIQQGWGWMSDKSDGMNRVATGSITGVAVVPLVPTRIPANSPIIDIKNLKKSYGLKPVLRGIDLELRQGERMALLGANGAGKTTLLRILAGLTKPDAGTITVAGLDCVRDAQQVRQMVGFVGHQPYLYEELTALENLLFFGRMYTVKHAQERALYLLQRVELEKRMQERVSTLSRGQVQRLAWARALLHSPRLLLLDEPDTGLDQDGTKLIDILLSEHSLQGGSIVFTTHQLVRALQLSDRVVILGNRRVAYQEETKSLDLVELQRAYREVER